jgi:hypothetical protein
VQFELKREEAKPLHVVVVRAAHLLPTLLHTHCTAHLDGQ